MGISESRNRNSFLVPVHQYASAFSLLRGLSDKPVLQKQGGVNKYVKFPNVEMIERQKQRQTDKKKMKEC